MKYYVSIIYYIYKKAYGGLNMSNGSDHNEMTVDHLKSTLDKIISDSKGDYKIDLCIFKDTIGHINTWYPKINVDVDDEYKTVTLSGEAI